MINENTQSFEEFLKNAEILLAPNALDFDVNDYEEEIQKEIDEVLHEVHESINKNDFRVQYTLTSDRVDQIIEKINKCDDVSYVDYYKTRAFLKANNLELKDATEILHNLKREDYEYNSIGKSNESEAIVFVKRTKIKDLPPFRIFIKLAYDAIEEKQLIVISFHQARAWHKGYKPKY